MLISNLPSRKVHLCHWPATHPHVLKAITSHASKMWDHRSFAQHWPVPAWCWPIFKIMQGQVSVMRNLVFFCTVVRARTILLDFAVYRWRSAHGIIAPGTIRGNTLLFLFWPLQSYGLQAHVTPYYVTGRVTFPNILGFWRRLRALCLPQ